MTSRVHRTVAVVVAALVSLLGTVTLGALPAAAATTTVVHPTGAYPADVEAVQAAVDSSDTVVLESVNAQGVPTAFDFGPADGNGVVLLEHAVSILGTTARGRTTRIRGGWLPFLGVAKSHTRIEGITFEAPALSAAVFIRSTGAEFVGNRVTGVAGTYLSFLDAYEGRGVKFLGNSDPAHAITGKVVVAGNRFDQMDADLSEAIVLDRVAAHVTVTDNVIEDVGGGGVLAIAQGGPLDITRNTVDAGPGTSGWHSGNGILVVGVDAPLAITRNTVRSENPMADGILVLGSAQRSFGTVEAPVISGNDLTNVHTWYGGITLLGDVNGAEVSSNRIVGSSAYGVGLFPFDDPSLAAGNRVTGNNVRGLDADWAHTVVLEHAVDTKVQGNAGTMFDVGQRTVSTGEGPVKAGFSRSRERERSARLERTVGAG